MSFISGSNPPFHPSYEIPTYNQEHKISPIGSSSQIRARQVSQEPAIIPPRSEQESINLAGNFFIDEEMDAVFPMERAPLVSSPNVVSVSNSVPNVIPVVNRILQDSFILTRTVNPVLPLPLFLVSVDATTTDISIPPASLIPSSGPSD